MWVLVYLQLVVTRKYGGDAEISPSVIHRETTNPANKKPSLFYFLELQHERFIEIPYHIPLCSFEPIVGLMIIFKFLIFVHIYVTWLL